MKYLKAVKSPHFCDICTSSLDVYCISFKFTYNRVYLCAKCRYKLQQLLENTLPNERMK